MINQQEQSKDLEQLIPYIFKMSPYTYKYVPGWLFWNGFYYIQFEGTKIDVASTKQDAENKIKLLNGAYRAGATQISSIFLNKLESYYPKNINQ